MNNSNIRPQAQATRRPQLIDGVRRPAMAALPERPYAPMLRPQLSAAPAAVQTLTPVVRRMTFQPPVVKKQHRMWRRLQLPVLVCLGLIGGLLAQNMLAGCVLAAAYGIIALVRRIPSRNTFALATMGLAVVCILLLVKPNGELVTNFSTYTFIFLITGVLSLSRESRLPRRTKRKR